MKILLLGATGFIGSNLVPILKNKYQLFAVGRKDYDLLDLNQAEAMFRNIQPQVVVHLAAKVGGILANKSYPAEFWYKNMLMTTYIWELCKKYAIEKMIYIMPGCAYPKSAISPMKEDDLFNGYPDEAPAPGALAKKMGLVASYAYKKQYGLNSFVLIPCNLFGKFDHFDEYNSHVIPALIMKMHKAKKTQQKEIVLWGSGDALRDFAYVEDIAQLMPYFIDNDVKFETSTVYDNVCNLSTSKGTSILKLAETIADIVGYEGQIVWDSSKIVGPADKRFDNTRMTSLGLKLETTLKDGLKKTYEWYKSII